MALGRSAIAETRTSLEAMSTSLVEAKEYDESFKKLFTDANFQKFVSETGKGTTINEQFNALYDWINQMAETLDTLKSRTDSFLNEQETINQ